MSPNAPGKTIAAPPLGVTAVMLPELDFGDQIALCQRLGLTHYTYRPRVVPAARRGEPYSFWGAHRFNLTPHDLLERATELRQQLQSLGLTPFGTVPAATSDLDDAVLDLHLRGAAMSGAGRVRINPRPYPRDGAIFDYAAFLEQVVADYRRITTAARGHAVKVVIETHAGTLAAGAALTWNIVRQFAPTVLGVILDLVNFAREGDNVPSLAVSMLRDYIDHIHVGGMKRVADGTDARGLTLWRSVFCPLAQTQTDLPGWWAALRAAGLHAAPWIIEDYTPDRGSVERLTDAVATLRSLFAEGRHPDA